MEKGRMDRIEWVFVDYLIKARILKIWREVEQDLASGLLKSREGGKV